MKKETVYKTFSHMPTLTTERLILRPMRQSDAEDMNRYAHREDVTEFLLWSPHPSLSYTREYLRYIESRYVLGDFYDWAVIEKASGRMIGTCGFTSFNCSSDSAEVGYVLNPAYWGKGIATEALTRVLRFGFEELKLHRIEARFICGNDRSRRVMEKVGMTFEGVLREGMLIKGNYTDIGICSILQSEWKKRVDKADS